MRTSRRFAGLGRQSRPAYPAFSRDGEQAAVQNDDLFA
jgi:hypothetical protein